MNERTLLQGIKKKKTRNATTIKYGMFGMSLGEHNYNRLSAYCTKHNLYKATVVKSLVVDYLDRTEKEGK